MTNTRLAVACALALLTGVGACSGGGGAEDVGAASIAVTSAPADVTCIRLTVTGARTVVRLLDVTPGQSTVFTLTGLPIGADTFNAEAFDLACGTLTNMSVPTWLSDPVQATLVSGGVTSVALSLHRNGIGSVSIDFSDDAGGGKAGNPVLHVAAGSNHSCAIIDQTIKCWGSNVFGQLGDGTFGGPPTPPRTVALGTTAFPIDVTAGTDFSCALLSDGSVKCWGRNDLDQVGDGRVPISNPMPTTVGTNGNVLAFSSGANHTCAIRGTRDVICWGGGAQGQLGNGGNGDGGPVQVATINDAETISAGRAHTCVTRAAGSVVSCWGDNTLGQLGNGTIQNISNVPTNVMFTGIASNLAAGSHHTCAMITTDQTTGGLFCWGAGGNGQFGNGDDIGSTVPKAAATSLQERILSVEAGGDYTCALVAGMRAAAFCWGLGDLGQLGDGMSTSTDTPVGIGKPMTFRSLSAGPAHACAGTAGGVLCWGQNPLGEIGDGTTTDRPSPTNVLF